VARLGGGGGTTWRRKATRWRGALPTTPTVPNTPHREHAFQQRMGYGGAGCSGARTTFLPGGEVAPRVFTDSRNDNDFWGSAVRLGNNLRITGELDTPVGGGGGGGGGDMSPSANCTLTGGDPGGDRSGGGGGGGGGVLIIKALGSINVTATGRLVADGGLRRRRTGRPPAAAAAGRRCRRHGHPDGGTRHHHRPRLAAANRYVWPRQRPRPRRPIPSCATTTTSRSRLTAAQRRAPVEAPGLRPGNGRLYHDERTGASA
jgi:hypothetical protein